MSDPNEIYFVEKADGNMRFGPFETEELATRLAQTAADRNESKFWVMGYTLHYCNAVYPNENVQ